MPRQPRVPSYSLHKPSGRAVVKVRLTPGGERVSVYLGKFGTDESREAYARLVADLLAGRPLTLPQSGGNWGNRTPETALTMSRLVAKYRDHAAGYYRKHGRATSEVHVIKAATEFALKSHSDLPADEFTPGDLRVIRDTMVDARLSRTTTNKYTGLIVRMFGWATSEQLVKPHVWPALKALPGLKVGRTKAPESAAIQPVDDATVARTLPKLPPVVQAMVKLQQATGMRPSEVCCLRPIDVDRRSDVWIYHPTEHKAQHHNKSRSVLLGPKAQEILRPYLLRPEREYCFRPDRHVAVPISQKRYRKDSYRRAIARACDRAFPAPKGTKDVEAWRREHRWAPNQLRHSFATYARETHGLEVAQILLGHARCDTTQVYAQASVAKGVEAARAIC